MSPTAKVKAKVVWRGAKALEQFLVPIADIQPWPGNARRSDVPLLRESLVRFGQVRAITTDADGRNLNVAGNHLVEAAGLEGWTHVAVIPNEFADEDEMLAYHVADNGIADRSDYDLELLAAQLDEVRSASTLDATGFSDSYHDRLRRELELMRAQATPPPEFPPLRPDDLDTDYCCPSCNYSWSGKPKPSGDSD